jgi:hypothetical protein
MLKNIFNSFLRVPHARFSSTIATTQSIYNPENYKAVSESPFVPKPREVWLENFDTEDVQRLDLLTLNPEIFADTPRIDLIHKNAHWQRMYRFVSFAHSKTRAECRGGGKKKINIQLSMLCKKLYFRKKTMAAKRFGKSTSWKYQSIKL